MAVTPLINSSAAKISRVESQVAKSQQAKGQQVKPEQQVKQEELTASRTELKARANQGIVEAMFGGPKQGADKAMNILYSEIMDKINAELGADHAVTAEKMAGQADDHWSAENTAGRIVDGALGFFETFQKQNTKMPEAEQVEKFLSIITKSIDKGYGEAVKVLDGLKVFDGSIKDNAEATRSIIEDKLAAFREAKLGNIAAE
ncbi:DUF5610 domain-containing protein [Oceanisphaera sp. W20_SRM_FM3]|uniref:DUF5610 domain-containing protein n=1 Tax=Oceanisphaera sp. W20_SRM_FM3 TaxID=3240267 RepID=UPI003F9431E1